jgi:hypothetical protein
MRSLILRILKKAVRLIEKIEKKELPTNVISDIILKNVFKGNCEKRVLISYLKRPFIEGIKYHHTNYLECYTAAEIFHELGYAVDVIDLMNNSCEIEYDEYEIVYGLGYALENSFYSLNAEKLIKIFYSTGFNPFYAYKSSLLQVRNFYLKSKKLIPQSSRVQNLFWANQYILSDLIIALGNSLVANSYIKTNSKVNVVPLPAFYFDIYDIDINSKDFEKAKCNYLWFGSSGQLHKGLDLLIDIFKEKVDINLHICGADKFEIKFWNHYNSMITSCENIIDYGFVDIQSDEFKNILDICSFAIFPSVSEGGAPALLNVMANGGLIPIATKTVGVDIFDIGFEIDEVSKDAILKQLEKSKMLNMIELKSMSIKVKSDVKKKYTYENYKKNLRSILELNLENLQV